MSKKYKEELDKIVMSEEMKKRILHNVLNDNIEAKSTMPSVRKYSLFKRNMQIAAACFTVVACLSIVKSNPQLFKQQNNNLEQKEILKDINDEDKSLQNSEESQSNDRNKDSKNDNNTQEHQIIDKNSNDNNAEEHQVINQYSSNDENREKSESAKNNKNNNLYENENSSKTKQKEESSGNSAANSNGLPNIMPQAQANANAESINPVSSDNMTKNAAKSQDEMAKNKNNNENESDTSPMVTCGYFANEYKTLEEAESAVNLKINSIKALPNGYSIDNVSVISNEIIQVQYNNGQDSLNFRAGKEIDNISGDYNAYKFENESAISGVNVSLKGSKSNVVNLATWEKDNISYSMTSTNGCDKEIMLNMIKSSLGQ